ncbi:hypothetical protein [Sphingomonas jaspsi]|uniref:hypothetical protein n=1 Tax=Sphingomonas jaspsi TaxID=392409 RepID=UPI0004AF832D|nr:hypothetical protein [Sphingomonas jaspsi]
MTRISLLLAATMLAAPAAAQNHSGHDDMGAMPMDHGQMDHDQTQEVSDPGILVTSEPIENPDVHSGMHMSMGGALGAYPMAREASGTAWQPDTSQHGGIHLMSGDWTFMVHGELNLVTDWQEGPRGDSKTFVAGMLMGMARRPLGDGTLQFKAMVSPDPLMGKHGYPLLLASGETADGVEHLVDRQHPHDFFMELSASISQPIGKNASVFLYGGLPGEPAFGPPAFMHRQSISTSPEAPISHHWLDSTHISFGVLTAGVVAGPAKLEISRFNGREPDQRRWNIETGPLDSTAVRVSVNPTRTLALQASWGKFKEPEQLEPGVDQKRLSASGTFTMPFENGWWSTTIAWGRKTVEHHKDDAWALESSVNWKKWTAFGRVEQTENRELLDDHKAYSVAKASIGLVRDFRIAQNLKFGVGGLYAFNFVPNDLKALYGGNPNGAMGFLRLKID